MENNSTDMEKYYKMDYRVGFSHCDSDRHMTIPALIDIFQDVACFDSESSGVGFFYLNPRGITWIIYNWQLTIEELPSYFDKITIGTAPVEVKGYFCYRHFFVANEKGEIIIRANSMWLLMDRKNAFPTRPDEYQISHTIFAPPIRQPVGGRKVTLQADYEEKRELPKIQVEQHHLDFNGHVNNGQYIKIAFSLCPDLMKKNIKGIRVEYTKEALLGDYIFPNVYTGKGWWFCELLNEQKEAYVKIEVKND